MLVIAVFRCRCLRSLLLWGGPGGQSLGLLCRPLLQQCGEQLLHVLYSNSLSTAGGGHREGPQASLHFGCQQCAILFVAHFLLSRFSFVFPPHFVRQRHRHKALDEAGPPRSHIWRD